MGYTTRQYGQKETRRLACASISGILSDFPTRSKPCKPSHAAESTVRRFPSRGSVPSAWYCLHPIEHLVEQDSGADSASQGITVPVYLTNTPLPDSPIFESQEMVSCFATLSDMRDGTTVVVKS